MPRSRRVALVAAPLATVAAIAAGVAATSAERGVQPAQLQSSVSRADLPSGREVPERSLGTSRSMDRVPLVNHRKPKPRDTMWTTADLNLRVEPRAKTKVVGVLDAGKTVQVTGRHQGDYAEVVVAKLPRWVTAEYLSQKKPKPATSSGSSGSSSSPAGVSSAPCPDGSGIEAGLTSGAVKLYRAVCAAFPELTTYGGRDGHGEHVSGQAIDFMVPNSSLGERVKDYVYAHRADFDLFDIIWSQHIWTIERSSEGFRAMSDRGSATANHYDHVHVKVN